MKTEVSVILLCYSFSSYSLNQILVSHFKRNSTGRNIPVVFQPISYTTAVRSRIAFK